MYNLGASNNFTIDLPFGTLCTGTTEGLPWPTGPATAARDLKREPLFPKPVSTSTVKTTSTSSVKKTSTSTTSATPTPSSDPVAECLGNFPCSLTPYVKIINQDQLLESASPLSAPTACASTSPPTLK